LVDQVRRAIDNGIRYLRQKEEGRGHWEIEAAVNQAHPGGQSALALLALLNCGVKADDPVIQRGLKYLRTVEPRSTYVVGLQTMVFVEAGQAEDKQRIQRNVDWLIKTRQMEDGKLLGWSYPSGGRSPDNSNTQYALLGLHAGKTAGAQIPREVWDSILNFYIDSQDKVVVDANRRLYSYPEGRGGWNYTAATGPAPRLTMTTAGFCGLLIAGMELSEGTQQLKPDGSAINCGIYKENEPAAAAYRWISNNRNFTIGGLRGGAFYNIYGIERAGRLSGERFFGGHDWYREGCDLLVGNRSRDLQQKPDGSWYASGSLGDQFPVVATSFALLFLSKGRTPILISKLVHDPEDDWNNKRNDVRHLVEYASKEVFKKQSVAWQIFDLSRVEALNREGELYWASQLLMSPIAYLNGHHGPRFTGTGETILKEYLNQGGFLFAEACCGNPSFDRGFRDLIDNRIFRDQPEVKLKRLDDNHPIWKAHALISPRDFPQGLWGVEMGCKTVVVYSPQPLAGYWEANLTSDNGRGQQAFRLMGNIIAYATGLEVPKPRLTPPEPIFDPKDIRKVPRGYVKVAQLKHEGDWHPAPRAMSNLMNHLKEQARLDVALKTEEINAAHPDLFNFKLMYMHGRNAFKMDQEELKSIRANLKTGGLLLADACCGKKAFDGAFRSFAEQLFPDHKLEPIPDTDELYSQELNGTAITTVRCRRERPGGMGAEAEFSEVPPLLEGIRINGRWVVIYSKYDIGCALEKHQSADCLGHDHASALRLGSAVVLYALHR
jgi:hypothetical protein